MVHRRSTGCLVGCMLLQLTECWDFTLTANCWSAFLTTGLLADGASWRLNKLPVWVKKVCFSWLKLSGGVWLCGGSRFILLSHQGVLRRMHYNNMFLQFPVIILFKKKNRRAFGRHRGRKWKLQLLSTVWTNENCIGHAVVTVICEMAVVYIASELNKKHRHPVSYGWVEQFIWTSRGSFPVLR